MSTKITCGGTGEKHLAFVGLQGSCMAYRCSRMAYRRFSFWIKQEGKETVLQST